MLVARLLYAKALPRATMAALRGLDEGRTRPRKRVGPMTYVVTEVCIKCKYMDCVEVCPVDCFYEGANMLVIHPDERIDCGVCEPECPVDAIKPDTEPELRPLAGDQPAIFGNLAEYHDQKARPGGCRRLRVRAGQIRQILHPRPG